MVSCSGDKFVNRMTFEREPRSIGRFTVRRARSGSTLHKNGIEAVSHFCSSVERLAELNLRVRKL